MPYFFVVDPAWWSAEQPLSSSDVQTIIARQFAELRGLPVFPLGEGWDSRAFEVGGRWVFRFPKRFAIQSALARERAILPQLQGRLPLRAPELEYVGEPSSLFPYTFVGYRKLEGVPLQLCLARSWSPVLERRLARQLGEFLSALHGVDPASLGIELPRAPEEALSAPLGEIEGRLPHLAAVDAGLLAELERHLARLPPARVNCHDRVLAHADLELEHLLFDPVRERLVGVIDWGDVCIAAPAVDFVGFYGFRGRAFIESVLERYSGPAAGVNVSWLAQRSICLALGQIGYGRLANQHHHLAAGLDALRNVMK